MSERSSAAALPGADRSGTPVPAPLPPADDDGHQVLRLPGGDPRPRPAPVRSISVRRTVGMPERRGSTPGGRGFRASAWGVSASVLVGGSILLYQMLFNADGDLEEWVTSPFSSSVFAENNGDRPLTNSDPDLPSKTDLIAPLVPSGFASSTPEESADPAADDDSSGPGSGDDSADPAVDDDSSGPGSGSDDDSSGSGSGGDDDSSGPGSGDDGDGDSSGDGSGGDGDSSGHGSGRDGDSSGPGSGGDGDRSG